MQSPKSIKSRNSSFVIPAETRKPHTHTHSCKHAACTSHFYASSFTVILRNYRRVRFGTLFGLPPYLRGGALRSAENVFVCQLLAISPPISNSTAKQKTSVRSRVKFTIKKALTNGRNSPSKSLATTISVANLSIFWPGLAIISLKSFAWQQPSDFPHNCLVNIENY